MDEVEEQDEWLTAGEKAQLQLSPALDAVFDYLDAHPQVMSSVQEVGIDVGLMAVDVYWVGGAFDLDTSSAFRAIEHKTSIPIRAIPVMLSGADISAAGDAILAQQSDARRVGHDLDTLVVGVTGDPAGRPAHLDFGNRQVALRYEQTDMAELDDDTPPQGQSEG